MAPFAIAVGAERDELLHHRKHRVADALGLRLQPGIVELAGMTVTADLFSRLVRDDAEARLHARQRGLDVEVVLHPRLV